VATLAEQRSATEQVQEQTTGLVARDSQARALIESAASMRDRKSAPVRSLWRLGAMVLEGMAGGRS
jgi:hypothetical protein